MHGYKWRISILEQVGDNGSSAKASYDDEQQMVVVKAVASPEASIDADGDAAEERLSSHAGATPGDEVDVPTWYRFSAMHD